MSMVDRVAKRYRQAGAHDFRHFVKGVDPKPGFKELVERKRWEDGHDAYSGSVGQKHDFKVRSHTPMSEAEARAFIDKDLDKADKWGDAFAIPVAEEAGEGPKKMVKVVVEADDDRAARNAAYKKALDMPAPAGSSWKYVGDSNLYDLKVEQAKSKKLPPFGKEPLTETYFKVWSMHNEPPRDLRDAKFGSKADAAKALVELIAKNPSLARVYQPYEGAPKGPAPTFKIIQVKELVKIIPPAEAAGPKLWNVEVPIAQVKKGGIKGWYFYGWVAS